MSSLRTYASLVRLEHTLFALPFAYAGTLLAVAATPARLSLGLLVFTTLAMVGARTLAMGLNRLVDAQIDARNPRTAGRELPSGKLRASQVWALCALSLGVLVGSTFALDPVTRVLWPIPVALFVLYPYTKRFTWLCHAVLGISIGLAPLGAWLAAGAGAGASPTPWLLWIGLALWIGGFDVVYATADLEFDRANGVQSLPARFGLRASLRVVRVAHAGTVVCFAAVGFTAALGPAFWVALVVAAALLAWESAIVRPDDLSRIDQAFFAVNSWVGVVLGAGIALGLLEPLRV